MNTTDKQIAVVEKIIQGATAALLAVCTYFLVGSLSTLNDLVDKVAELNTRVSILEYANGRR